MHKKVKISLTFFTQKFRFKFQGGGWVRANLNSSDLEFSFLEGFPNAIFGVFRVKLFCMFSLSPFCYFSKSLTLFSFSYSFSKILFQIWASGVFITWVPGEIKKQFHCKNTVFSTSCSHSPSLYWVNKMIIFLFLNWNINVCKNTNQVSFNKSKLCGFGFWDQKNVFNPIIEKLAILEKTLRLWRKSISHDSFHSCWWILN